MMEPMSGIARYVSSLCSTGAIARDTSTKKVCNLRQRDWILPNNGGLLSGTASSEESVGAEKLLACSLEPGPWLSNR